MNQPIDNKEAAPVADTVIQSELIAALEALVPIFRRESGKATTNDVQDAWAKAADLLEKTICPHKEQEEKQWCCIVEGFKITDCVLDYNSPKDCVHAPKFNKREECPFWKLA